MKKIKFIEIRSELGAGTTGASKGVDAIRLAASDAGSTLFVEHDCIRVKDANYLPLDEADTPNAIKIEGIVQVFESLCNEVALQLSDRNNFPIVLAGDHSSAGGTIAGIKKHFPEKRLGVIWIDAHADLHSPFTSPSGNVHGMPVATAIAEDNLSNKRNEVAAETVEYWARLKNMGGLQPKITPADLVFIAVRETEFEEDHLIKKYGIRNFSVEEVTEKGEEQVADEVLDYLAGCELIYISFDVDSLDSSISLGTGTPVPNGLTVEQASALIRFLLTSQKVCCLEIVEVNPDLDNKGNRMAEIAFSILEQAVEVLDQHEN